MTGLMRLVDRFWPALTLGLVAVVTALSLAPLAEWEIRGPGSDKLQHLVAYAALAVPAALARPRGWAWVIGLLALWSGAIELVQPLVGRQTSALDFAANAAGLGLGVALAAAVRRAVWPR